MKNTKELSEVFPASKEIFDAHIAKTQKTMKMFRTIIVDLKI